MKIYKADTIDKNINKQITLISKKTEIKEVSDNEKTEGLVVGIQNLENEKSDIENQKEEIEKKQEEIKSRGVEGIDYIVDLWNGYVTTRITGKWFNTYHCHFVTINIFKCFIYKIISNMGVIKDDII